MPDNLGGKRVNVTEKRKALCSCEKHSTMAYFLENGYICAYCETEKGFMWHENKNTKVAINKTKNNCNECVNIVINQKKKKNKKKKKNTKPSDSDQLKTDESDSNQSDSNNSDSTSN